MGRVSARLRWRISVAREGPMIRRRVGPGSGRDDGLGAGGHYP